MKYAVQIEIDTGEWQLVGATNPWTYDSGPMLFDTYAAAAAHASTWNTGKVIDYQEYIRPMTKEERLRAFEKEQANNA